MLMGFPLDFLSTEHIQNALASFRRVLTWEYDPTNLTRILVKARVTNLEDARRHIAFFKIDGFQG
jgi:hypothetical protein